MNLARGSILTVKGLNNNGYPCSLTIDRLYKARVGQFECLGVWDNENNGYYGYDWDMFEIVKDGWDGVDAEEHQTNSNRNRTKGEA